MSDTTAFLTGCATAGAAAVLLLVDRVGFHQPRSVSQVQPPPTIAEVSPSPSIPPPPTNTQNFPELEQRFRQELNQQQTTIGQLQVKLEQQRIITEQIKSQLEQKNSQIETLVAQMQEHQRFIDTRAAQQVSLSNSAAQSSTSQKLLVWVVGGMFVILAGGGGILLIGLIVLLAQPQRRSPRTTQIIHPVSVPQPYSYVDQDFLPPQIRPRHARAVDYEN
ncbi:MAG: hypothetical protein F6K19_44575 [Cyanothece sp. SIO1E1]|nr:hypothetical protein [Cyanothece sp. SIO1E1]